VGPQWAHSRSNSLEFDLTPLGPPLKLPEVVMVSIEPLRIEIDREDDGRVLTSVRDLPGVMAYGDTQDAAVRKAKSIALQVLADMVESGDELPQPR
jgi:predicted RNase H-like HicB family nuclease